LRVETYISYVTVQYTNVSIFFRTAKYSCIEKDQIYDIILLFFAVFCYLEILLPLGRDTTETGGNVLLLAGAV
jgi:hypothetical protein